MSIKVSVIIPVYNGETFLEQCLDTVCNQTLKEIEIICVDDGSTDSSYEILKRYEQRDSRITVLQQNNQYAGAARNTGKKIAKGDYLVFWDCDDFFELEALEMLYQEASETNADVCVCGVNQYFQDTERLIPNNVNYFSRSKIQGDRVFNRVGNEDTILNFTNAVPWNKMFRRQYIEDLNLDFQAIRNGNDIYFTMNAIYFAERIATVQTPLINYRCNQDNSLFGTLKKSPLVPLQAWIDVAENFEKLEVFPEKTFANKAVGSVIYLLRNMGDYDAFCKTVAFLKDGGLKRLHLQVKEPGFYYTAWHNEFLRYLWEEDMNQILMYLEYMTYENLLSNTADLRVVRKQLADTRRELKDTKKELRLTNKELQKTAKQLEETVNSWSFKTGKVLMWLPGKIKRLFRKK